MLEEKHSGPVIRLVLLESARSARRHAGEVVVGVHGNVEAGKSLR